MSMESPAPTYVEICRGIEEYYAARMWRELATICNLAYTLNLSEGQRTFIDDTKRVADRNRDTDERFGLYARVLPSDQPTVWE